MKLPLAPIPQRVNVTSGSPPFSLPVRNPRMDMHMNDGLFQTVGDSLRSVNREVTQQINQHQMKLQQAQDYSDLADANNKAKLSIGNYMNSLDGKPDYESYAKGLTELQQNLNESEEIKKLRPELRQVIKLQHDDMFTEAQIKANHAARKEQVTQMRTKALGRYEAALQSGDFSGAENEVKAGMGLEFISAAHGQQLLDNIAPKEAFYQARTEIESGDPIAMAEMLNDKGKDGTFTHFKALTDSDRSQLKNFAAARKNQNETAALEELNLSAYDRTLTLEKVDRAVRSGAISPARGLHYQNSLMDVNRQRKFNTDDYEALDAARSGYLAGRIDKREYMKTYEKYSENLPETYLEPFKKVFENDNKPDAVEKKRTYKQGMEYIDSLDKAKMIEADYNFVRTKPEKRAMYKKQLEGNFYDYLERNPDASDKEVVNFIKDATAKVREDKLGWEFGKSYGKRGTEFKKDNSLQSGTIDGEYRFKGGDPADMKNWEKVK